MTHTLQIFLIKKKHFFILPLLLTLLFTGCSIKSEFYGKYNDTNEVYEGYADFGSTDGKIEIWSKKTSENCSGDITYSDGEVSFITGIYSGTSTLTCTSGKTLKGQWYIPANWNYNAKGQFVDSKGKVMLFVFGETINRYKHAVFAPPEVYTKPKPRIVISPQKKYEVKTGTGFFITGNGHLITNNHVINNSSKIYVKKGDEQFIAKVIDTDSSNDLAVLKVDYKSKPIYLFKEKEVRKGTKITSFGYPLIGIQGNELKTTFGHINSITGLQGDDKFYQIDTPIQPGNSGGPILNYYGEAIGVVTATLNQQSTLMNEGTFTQNVNYAVKIDRVLSLLEKNDIHVNNHSSKQKLDEVELVNNYEKSVVIIISH